MTREEMLGAIYEAIGRVNELRADHEKLACSEETHLYGSGGNLDSLALVALVLDVEEILASRFGIITTLADAQAVAQYRTPFRTVSSFADYVLSRIGGDRT